MSIKYWANVIEDNVEEVEATLDSAEAFEVSTVDPDDGYTALQKACKAGATKVISMLLKRKADPNYENAQTLETCLHLAADTYREDPDGKIEYEDMIQELVAAGALCFPDRTAKYPDVGDDAVSMVEKAMQEAEKKGKTELKERLDLRKARGQEAFQKAMQDHISNASACAVTVLDSGQDDGYKFGSRDAPK